MSRPQSYLGEVIDWDDGHVPERLRAAGRLVRYSSRLQRPPVVQVADSGQHSLSEDECDTIYQYTVAQSTPWGNYVTIDEVKAFWEGLRVSEGCKSSVSIGNETKEEREKRLALPAVVAFMRQARENRNLWTEDDLEQAHGVAVWALSSEVGSSVPYHLDYAEQIRYRTNVIVPPVLAGTLHCTSSPIKGGKYCANLQGLEHYQKHGYKGKKSGCRDASDFLSDNDWVHVDYRYNRLICQSGHLPHLSTLITHIQDPGVKRVVVGFNVFLSDVGQLVQQAPEHSDAFRAEVRAGHQQNKLSLETIRQNSSLSRLLLLARKEKERQDKMQRIMYLDGKLEQHVAAVAPVTVGALVARIERDAGESISLAPLEAHIHIHRRYREGKLVVSKSSTDQTVEPGRGVDGLIVAESVVWSSS